MAKAETKLAVHAALDAAKPKTAGEVLSEQDLAALQSRVEALHAAQLLGDDELFCLEDAVADCIEATPMAAASVPSVAKVIAIISLSQKMGGDAAFARQLRRKYV